MSEATLSKWMSCLLLAMSGASGALAAPATFPDAVASDPATLGWMVGSPPPAAKQLRFDDGSYFRFPAMRSRWCRKKTALLIS